jgi:Predicted metal-dependent hydrolase with the TIM-barrel fold
MKLLLVVLSVLVLSLAPTQTRITTADIVFKNGNVYTANDRSPKAQAIAIKSDRIVYVGSNAGVQTFVGTNTELLI